jgi:hypothetical protein
MSPMIDRNGTPIYMRKGRRQSFIGGLGVEIKTF